MADTRSAFSPSPQTTAAKAAGVDSSPHFVATSGLTVSGFKGFFGYLGYRHTSNYILDGEDPTIRASGLDVLDFSMRQRIRSWG